ncbi:molybdate-binding protein [Pedobacter sp. UYEF25]
METSYLEITDKEYCIKLNKDSFDLSLVRNLIKRIQAESFFSNKKQSSEDHSFKSNRREDVEGYDYLEDK